jgi:hypothetical protein
VNPGGRGFTLLSHGHRKVRKSPNALYQSRGLAEMPKD